MTSKKLGAQTAIVGALAFAAVGLGTGVASADQLAPTSPGVTWKVNKPHWGDLDDWDDWDDWGRGRGGHIDGPCEWVPPAVDDWVPRAVC